MPDFTPSEETVPIQPVQAAADGNQNLQLVEPQSSNTALTSTHSTAEGVTAAAHDGSGHGVRADVSDAVLSAVNDLGEGGACSQVVAAVSRALSSTIEQHVRAAFEEPDMQTFLEATVRLAFAAAVEREVEAQLSCMDLAAIVRTAVAAEIDEAVQEAVAAEMVRSAARIEEEVRLAFAARAASAAQAAVDGVLAEQNSDQNSAPASSAHNNSNSSNTTTRQAAFVLQEAAVAASRSL
eukprot:16518-Heterococcus_DN1.PRE.3